MTYPRVDAFDLDSQYCFAGSRRLTGMNRYVSGPAAILESQGPLARDVEALCLWKQVAATMAFDLWGAQEAPIIRQNSRTAELVLPCPFDQQLTATEVNEYAWETAALGHETGPASGSFERLHRFRDASETRRYFLALAAAEREPRLQEVLREAASRGVPAVLDDEDLSLGGGHRSRLFPLSKLPRVDDIEWDALGAIPVALVTGSNGKTTTTRLIAAMLDAARENAPGATGMCGTEGIFVGGQRVERGDYSGPAGARAVLRDSRVTAAVLETARGGILRRGLAVSQADVSVVTNVSADHFGEYGIESLEDIAETKLAVARPLHAKGTLVLNGDDEVLMRFLPRMACAVALFSMHGDPAGRNSCTGPVCYLEQGELILRDSTRQESLGSVADMPLAVRGAADYNIANLAAAALAAYVLKVPLHAIREVMCRFGAQRSDNPGRFERWQIAGIEVVMDYAHNPDGLARLLRVCQTLKAPGGHLRLLLGQAGNRTDEDIRDLAQTAASFDPHRVVIKELPEMLRGRALGAVPALLREALIASGVGAGQIALEADEVSAARSLAVEAHAGDVVVLPVHATQARARVSEWLEQCVQRGRFS